MIAGRLPKRIEKWLLGAIIALFLLGVFWPRWPRGEIRSYGILQFEAVSLEPEAGSPCGFRFEGDGSIAIETDEIPANVDGFGIDYVVRGLEPNSTEEFRFVISHPKLEDNEGRALHQQAYDVKLNSGADGTVRNLSGYVTGNPKGALKGKGNPPTGDWTLEIWHQNHRLIRKTFRVIPPDAK